MQHSNKTKVNITLLNTLLSNSIDSILTAQQDSGAINGYCESRVLESTLALHLLRNLSFLQLKQQRIEHYLLGEISKKNHNSALHGLEKIILKMAELVLHNNTNASKEMLQLLNLLLHNEQGRKGLYFGCLFAELGVLQFSELPFDFSAFQNSLQPLQTWARVMICSLKILYCYGTSKESLITLEDKNFLTEKLFEVGVYENNVLTQIVGLLALSKMLDKKRLEAPIHSLMNWQQPNGGLPLMTGLDNFITPLAGLAAIEALPHLSMPYQQTVQNALLRMTNYIASVQAENGGWSYMLGTTQTDVDDSGLCCALLAMVNPIKFDAHLLKVEHYIKVMQHKDGGFPTYIKGNPSTPSMAAAALHGIAELLLHHTKIDLAWKNSIHRTMDYLTNSQKKDGTFERRWSNAETHAMYRVAAALRSVQNLTNNTDLNKMNSTIMRKMQHYFYENQNADGGWGFTSTDNSDIMSTAYAMLCFTKNERDLATKGMNFLIAQQENNDILKFKPDLLGPRPLPYNIPVLPLVMQTCAFAYFMKVFY